MNNKQKAATRRLINGINRDNLSVVNEALRAGAVLDSRQFAVRNTLPLEAALHLNNQHQIVEALINAGADINSRYVCPRGFLREHLAITVSGSTPLHLALRSRNTRAVNNLIAAGADVNLLNDRGCSPFHIIGWHILNEVSGRRPALLRTLKELVGAGADVNLPDERDETLYEAVLEEIADEPTPPRLLFLRNVARFLRENGARVANVNPEMINPNQSTNMVDKSANNSAKDLLLHYGEIKVEAQLTNLETYLGSLAKDKKNLTADPELNTWLKPAQEALKKIINRRVTHSGSEINLRTLLAYAWKGICDKKALKNSGIAVLSNEDIKARKRNLIQHLYECQRGYNLNVTGQDDNKDDAPICGHGHFNKIISALAGGHDVVQITSISEQLMTLKAQALAKEVFEALPQEQKKAFLPKWTTEKGMPKRLWEHLKPKVTQQLEENFGDYKYSFPGYKQAVEGALGALEYMNPPQSPVALSPQGGQERRSL